MIGIKQDCGVVNLNWGMKAIQQQIDDAVKARDEYIMKNQYALAAEETQRIVWLRDQRDNLFFCR